MRGSGGCWLCNVVEGWLLELLSPVVGRGCCGSVSRYCSASGEGGRLLLGWSGVCGVGSFVCCVAINCRFWYLSLSGMLSLALSGGPARMLCMSLVIFLAGSLLMPVTIGRMILTV